MHGFYGDPSRRKLIYYRYIKGAVKGHRKRSWYRCGSHYKYMGRIEAFLPKPGSLFNSEPVLLVNNYQSQVSELYIFLDQCMCADKDIQRLVKERFADILSQ